MSLIVVVTVCDLRAVPTNELSTQFAMCVVFGTGLSRRCLGDNFDQRLRMTHTSFIVTADNRFILAVGFWDKSYRVFSTDSGTVTVPCAGSGVESIDPLRFLARCCKRQLNQALPVLSLSTDSGTVTVLLLLLLPLLLLGHGAL